MILMVRGVQVLPIPTRREQNVAPNTTQALALGESLSVQLRVLAWRGIVAGEVRAGETAEAVLEFGACGCATGWVAHEHAEAGLESGHFSFAGGDVVDYEAALSLWAEFVAEQ